MTENLKPCPFCGHSDSLKTQKQKDETTLGMFYFVCCDACEYWHTPCTSPKEAAKYWNRRRWYPEGNEYLSQIAKALTKLNRDEMHASLFPWHDAGWEIDSPNAADIVCKIINDYDAKAREVMRLADCLNHEIKNITEKFSRDINDMGDGDNQ